MSPKEEAITVEELIAFLQGYLKDCPHCNKQKVLYLQDNSKYMLYVTGIEYDQFGKLWLK